MIGIIIRNFLEFPIVILCHCLHGTDKFQFQFTVFSCSCLCDSTNRAVNPFPCIRSIDKFAEHGYTASGNETAYLILGIFGLAIVSMAIMQNDFNSLSFESTQSEFFRRPDDSLISKFSRLPIQHWGWLFLLPTFAAFCIGFLWPFAQGLFLSFCKFKITSQWEWVGFDNYAKAFSDPSFMHAFWYTALFAVVSLIAINVLAFAAAYALTQNIKGTNIFRTVFFMPNLIGGIVLAFIWSMIFDGILVAYGTSILLKTSFGFWGLIILMCWQQIGYMMIIYIAGLQAVPEDMIEAAKIDGANKWQTLTRVTIPNIMPSITICTFLTLTNSFKLFDQNFALTGGRPFEMLADGTVIKTTEMLALNIYNSFYTNLTNRGIGQAKAVLFFILVVAIGLFQLRATRSKEVQQ